MPVQIASAQQKILSVLEHESLWLADAAKTLGKSYIDQLAYRLTEAQVNAADDVFKLLGPIPTLAITAM